VVYHLPFVSALPQFMLEFSVRSVDGRCCRNASNISNVETDLLSGFSIFDPVHGHVNAYAVTVDDV